MPSSEYLSASFQFETKQRTHLFFPCVMGLAGKPSYTSGPHKSKPSVIRMLFPHLPLATHNHPTIYYVLPIIYELLFITHYLLPITHHLLFTIHHFLFSTYCPPRIAYYILRRTQALVRQFLFLPMSREPWAQGPVIWHAWSLQFDNLGGHRGAWEPQKADLGLVL